MISIRQPTELTGLVGEIRPLMGMGEIKTFYHIFPDPSKQGGSWKDSFMKILSHFAKCLHKDSMQGDNLFTPNLLDQIGPCGMFMFPLKSGCMLIDWEKVQSLASKEGYLLFKSHKGKCAKNKRKRSPPYLEAKLGKGERHTVLFSAHRMLCFAKHGHPPPGKEMVLHTCGVSHCLNPLHLKWGDAKENSYHNESSYQSNTIGSRNHSVRETISQPTHPVDYGMDQMSGTRV